MVPCTSYAVKREAVNLLISVTCQDDGKRVSVKGVFSWKEVALSDMYLLSKKERNPDQLLTTLVLGNVILKIQCLVSCIQDVQYTVGLSYWISMEYILEHCDMHLASFKCWCFLWLEQSLWDIKASMAWLKSGHRCILDMGQWRGIIPTVEWAREGLIISRELRPSQAFDIIVKHTRERDGISKPRDSSLCVLLNASLFFQLDFKVDLKRSNSWQNKKSLGFSFLQYEHPIEAVQAICILFRAATRMGYCIGNVLQLYYWWDS
jgi:hypothetical protein